MKLRNLSIFLIIALCISLVPITVAAGAAVSLNAISPIHPGGSVTIKGTSELDEVSIKVLRPGNSTVFYDIVKVTGGQFTDSFTLGSNEPTGTYTVIAGQADQVARRDLDVTATPTPTPSPSTGPTPTPSPSTGPAASSNADLSGLTLSSGTLTPAFTPGNLYYSADVANDVSSITVNATAADGNATISANAAAAVPGQASRVINLSVGTNLINVVVTAQNGTTTKRYTVTVKRESSSPPPPSGPGTTTSPTPASDKVTSTDGKLTLPAGKLGEVSLGDEIKISIPVGASGKELKLTIEKVLDAQKLLTNKDVLISPVFEVLKNFSENFSKPVTLTFAFDPKSLKDGQKPAVFYYDELNKKWVEVAGGKVNGNHITVEVDHFTKYAVLAVGQATDTPVKEVSFSDIAGHWAEAGIKQAVSAGIVSGYPDGTFKPDHSVTRSEFAVMLMNALKPQGEGTALTFTDTAKIGAWAQKSVAQAVYAGIITGYEDSTFRPDFEITRPEMAVMITKALGQSTEATTATGFADDKAIPDWAKGAVAAMKKLGVIEGKGANEFAPDDKTTRAEAVTVLLKMQAKKSK